MDGSQGSAFHDFVSETCAGRITPDLLERFERVTGRKPHRLLRRGIVSCHRDLEIILDKHERKEPFYIFTGRGPSSDSLHLGHSIPFELAKWLQDVFGVPLIIMLTDDMKLLHTPNLDVSTAQRYAITNGRDILAFGFNPAKTFMFSNLAFVGGPFYENIVRVARMISVASMKRALGFNDDNNVGMFYCCSTQSAGTFATSYPDLLKSSGPDLDPNRLKNIHCLVACSWDIDGYFSEVRKHAEALGYQRPAFIYSSLLPGLQGAESKMSASVQFSSVYLTDEPMVVRAKIEHAFAEGKLDTPTVFVYLKAFLDDDAELDRMQTGFEDGTVGRNRLKEVLMQAVLEVLGSFQESREVVTREYMDKVMGKRMLF